jgi:hypothetical protein
MSIRRNFYLANRHAKKIKNLSKKLGLSQSDLIRRAIDYFDFETTFEKKKS